MVVGGCFMTTNKQKKWICFREFQVTWSFKKKKLFLTNLNPLILKELQFFFKSFFNEKGDPPQNGEIFKTIIGWVDLV